MNKEKIIWIVATVALTGIFVYSFCHEHDGVYCQIACSKGFAFFTGLVIYRTGCLYIKK